MLVMASRRILTLSLLRSGHLQFSGRIHWDLSEAAALATCLASLLLLSGIALIGPVYRSVSAAEAVLRLDNEKLKGTVQSNAAELELARRIQEKLLPAAPPVIEGFDIASISLPAESVGGDSFDFRPLTTGEWLFSVTDVSGHGVGPALQMAQLQTAFRTLSTTMNNPAEMLQLANRLFHETSPSGRFATVFLGVLDPATGEVRYASAGHQAWVLRHSSSECVLLGGRSSGLVVGVMAEVDYRADSVQLQPGDALLLTTDGCSESCSPEGELLGVDRMLESVRQNMDAGALAGMQSLVDATVAWRGERPQLDDITILLVIRRSVAAQ